MSAPNRFNIPDELRRNSPTPRGRGRGRGRGNENVHQHGYRGVHQEHGSGQDESGNANESNPKPNQSRRPAGMGYKSLEEISHLGSCDALVRISNEKVALLELLQNPLQPNFYVLLLRILANICSSDFNESKGRVLVEVCNSNFIPNLQNYLINLIYISERAKRSNELYWKDAATFWRNLFVLCETLMQLSPSTALQHCRALVDVSMAVCLEGLRERHGYNLPPELTVRLNTLRERFTHCETIVEKEKNKPRSGLEVVEVGPEPPENFRALPVLPTLHELTGEMPFVRPNLVDGGYQSVEHYLDVQFRLLREDCYGPLREGIKQYKLDPTKRKIDNIRVHREVVILEPHHSQTGVGSILVQFEKKNAYGKPKRHVNWAYSKRFMFGALLLLSDDQCKSFKRAIVFDRDTKMLEKGIVPVRFDSGPAKLTTSMYGRSYLMIESEVYFEPYYHVLGGLQDPVLARGFPMQRYIVQVQPDTNPPAYLTPDTEYIYKANNEVALAEARFRPLLDDTWPSAEQLGLDDSQYSAYKLLLTHEFALVQGPPGTGKTYLGALAARTLLNSLPSRMMVICYTNHALDQFLEAILAVTDSIARIGGQSKSEILEPYTLINLRKRNIVTPPTPSAKFFLEKRYNLKCAARDVITVQKQLDIVNNGMVDYMSIVTNVPELSHLFKPAGPSQDPIYNWLFENITAYEVNEDVAAAHRDDDESGVETEDTPDLGDDPHRSLILDEDVEFIELEYDMRNVFDVDVIKYAIEELSEALRTCESHREVFIRKRITSLRSRLNCFMAQRKRRFEKSKLKITDRPSPDLFSNNERWEIYFNWMKIMRRILYEKISVLQKKQRAACEECDEARLAEDLKLLQDTRVVGITTTGAARLQKLLRSLATPIVIVEEAAEVLESHIVVSLTPHCQHLILIGDHQQLRPAAAHYKLARHYNMEVSLFERMITNGMPSRRLGVQHRMRPAIAALIAPTIYSDLRNHASVENYPPVRGVTVDVFFLTHNNPEDMVEDSSSRSNKAEADLTLALANYIMQQGYRPEHLTILVAYSGQLFYMWKEKKRYDRLKDVKIKVVDNYQGEESEIILLSLVRNNSEGVIGFLANANRVCVALSRAKQGFYILGNMEMLRSKAELWQQISEVLERQRGLGPRLTLRCEVHPDQITQVEKAEDFARVPEGGCMLKCDDTLPCAHPCPLVCHGYDRSHEIVQCPRMCERVLCEMDHKCPLPCAVKCAPCAVPMLKKLPCGHEQTVACHIDPNDHAVLCSTLVDVTLPACGHQMRKECHVDVKSAPCTVACPARLPCGHACTLHCHKASDPDHQRYTCEKPCAKTREGCTAEAAGWELGPHACPKKCHETCDPCNIEVLKRHAGCGHRERTACAGDVDATPCRHNCKRILPCGHHCKNKCNEPCGNCSQKVKKVLDGCGHEVAVGCSEEPRADQCGERCKRTLPCGHACTLPCREACTVTSCRELLPQVFRSPCGHDVRIHCSDNNEGKAVSEEVLLRRCRAPCDATLMCEHGCAGSCGECRQGRLHVPCAQPCDRLLLCGHKCEEPCRAVCPPCRKPCEVRCPHSSCDLRCGELCPPCKERCSRRCPHGECARRCDEPCARAPCAEPCPLLLPCGHPCCGLCGEPCPDACRTCRPEDFPTDLLGDPYPDDAKLIQLQDCPRTGTGRGHFLEVEDMDNLMYGDREAIMIRACPFCRTLILNTQRYKDQINATFRDEIQPIKRRVNGDPDQIRDQCTQLSLRWRDHVDLHSVVGREYRCWEIAMWKLGKAIVDKQPRLSLLQVNLHAVSLDVLHELAECGKQAPSAGDELRPPFVQQMELVCGALALDANKISEQQQQDLERELRRTRALTQLSALMATPAYRKAASEPRVLDAHRAAASLVLSWQIFRAGDTRAALELLQQEIRVSGVVSQEERGMIVRAMNLKQGHWFKCPNGHIYCIGECGGAMERSRCPECRAAIGGTNHALLSDNKLAPEMDNATHAAWSNANRRL